MTTDRETLTVNAFAGGFLLLSAITSLVVVQNVLTSTLLLVVGVFLLTRALAQHQHQASAD